jgi:hypothetical protein
MRCIGCNRRWDRAELELTAVAPPECPDCHGIVKSDTVMFGEPIPPDAINRSFEAERRLLPGHPRPPFCRPQTSPDRQRNGGRLIEVNPLNSQRLSVLLCSVNWKRRCAGGGRGAKEAGSAKSDAGATEDASIVARDRETGVRRRGRWRCPHQGARPACAWRGRDRHAVVRTSLPPRDSICWQGLSGGGTECDADRRRRPDPPPVGWRGRERAVFSRARAASNGLAPGGNRQAILVSNMLTGPGL